MMRKLRYVSLCIVVAMIVTMGTGLFERPAAAADEYDELRLRWQSTLTGGAGYDTSDPDIAARIANMNDLAQMHWDNMNTSPGRTSLWSDLSSTTVSGHITSSYERLKRMASAYVTVGADLHNDSALLSDLISALDWLHANRYNASATPYENWFAWEIGIPLHLNDIVIMLYDHLTSTQITNYMNAVDRFSPNPTRAVNGTQTATGANLIWKSTIVALRGIIVKSSPKIAAARDAISPVFDYVTAGDGFYQDGSFRQHGKYSYNLGYGSSPLFYSVNLSYLLDASTWEITDPDKNNVYRWVYEAFEPIIYRGVAMDMTRGRNISRFTSIDQTAALEAIYAITRLSQFAPPADEARLKGMLKHWLTSNSYSNYFSYGPLEMIVLGKEIVSDPSVTSRGELAKHVVYPNMDRAVHLRPDFALGISMSSNRIGNYESINNENLKGWYTGDGMTYLYNNDLGQYSDAFWPTVNPYRLPGTTVDTMARANASGQGYNSPSTWAGGSEIAGLYGATGMLLDAWNNTLTARKSWFSFDDEIVALGSGITSTDSRTIETIVENRQLTSAGDNTLTVDGSPKPAGLGWTETMTGVSWAHLQGNVSGSDIGYYFPGATTVKGLREARTGAWFDINHPQNNTTSYTRNYMNLWFDHGSNPSGKTYAYVLLPGKSSTEVAGYAGSPDITILENSAAAHAVKEETLNITAANFWTDTAKTAGPITSNKKASVMLKEDGDEFELSVSDPTQSNTGTITVEIDRPAAGGVAIDPQVTVLQYSPTLIVSVNVNASRGKTFHAKFQGHTLTSIADAYVQASTPDTNFGSAVDNVVKDRAGQHREAYMKFDVSGESGRIASAKLIVYGAVADGAGTAANTNVYQTTTNTWTESGITWNNKPARGSLLGTIPFDSAWKRREIDVTAYVQQQIDGDGTASFVFAQDLGGLGLNTGIRGKEGTQKPYLLIQKELPPTADAYVQNGAQSNTNYGGAPDLIIKDGGASASRMSFLKFNLASVTGTVNNAKLYVYGALTDRGAVSTAQTQLYSVHSDTWQETTVVWNNKPALGSLLVTKDIDRQWQWVEYDVTAFVQSQLAGDKVASFALTQDLGGVGWFINFKSKGSGMRPYLIIE